jgi:hypothetical protein
MDDEKYAFEEEVREKKIIARSAHKRTVKGGRVRLHSDYLSKKELKKMSGEAKTYNISQPMKWAEFKSMPDDLKREYIKNIREKFGVTDALIADMLDVHRVTLCKYFKTLGIANGYKHSKIVDNGGYQLWCGGKSPVAVDPLEKITECEPVPSTEIKVLPAKQEPTKVPPKAGQMCLDGRLEDILPTLTLLLGGAEVSLAVSWELLGGKEKTND